MHLSQAVVLAFIACTASVSAQYYSNQIYQRDVPQAWSKLTAREEDALNSLLYARDAQPGGRGRGSYGGQRPHHRQNKMFGGNRQQAAQPAQPAAAPQPDQTAQTAPDPNAAAQRRWAEPEYYNEHIYAREAEPEASSYQYDLYTRDAEPEADFEELALYAREAEPEYEYDGIYAREAEPDYEELMSLYARDADPEAWAESFDLAYEY